jgi:hypothetical protein
MAGVTLILGIVLYQDFGLVSKDWSSCGNEYIPNETVFICLAVEIIINLLYVLWLKTEWRKMEPESPNEVILAQKFIQDQRYAEFRYLNVLYIILYLYPII